jgi:hypothetical protein
MTLRFAPASDGANPIDARYHRAWVMASTVFGLVIDFLHFVGFGRRSRARLAAENLSCASSWRCTSNAR